MADWCTGGVVVSRDEVLLRLILMAHGQTLSLRKAGVAWDVAKVWDGYRATTWLFARTTLAADPLELVAFVEYESTLARG